MQAWTRSILFANTLCRSAFGKSLCTYERCWKWCTRTSIQAWTHSILFANTFYRSVFGKSLFIYKSVESDVHERWYRPEPEPKHTATFLTHCITFTLRQYGDRIRATREFANMFSTENFVTQLLADIRSKLKNSFSSNKCKVPLLCTSLLISSYMLQLIFLQGAYTNTAENVQRKDSLTMLMHINYTQGYSKWLSEFQQLVIHNTLEIGECSCTDGSRNSQSFLLWCAVCSSYALLIMLIL
jgi:hypothetical protein